MLLSNLSLTSLLSSSGQVQSRIQNGSYIAEIVSTNDTPTKILQITSNEDTTRMTMSNSSSSANKGVIEFINAVDENDNTVDTSHLDLRTDISGASAKLSIYKDSTDISGILNVDSTNAYPVNIRSNQDYSRIVVSRNYNGAHSLYVAYACLLNTGATAIREEYGYIKRSDCNTSLAFRSNDVIAIEGSSKVLLQFNTTGSDKARILFDETTSNSGSLEIATGDDGTEPIYVRQYSGDANSSFATVSHELCLLDSSGNTTLNGILNINTSNVETMIKSIGSNTTAAVIEVGQNDGTTIDNTNLARFGHYVNGDTKYAYMKRTKGTADVKVYKDKVGITGALETSTNITCGGGISTAGMIKINTSADDLMYVWNGYSSGDARILVGFSGNSLLSAALGLHRDTTTSAPYAYVKCYGGTASLNVFSNTIVATKHLYADDSLDVTGMIKINTSADDLMYAWNGYTTGSARILVGYSGNALLSAIYGFFRETSSSDPFAYVKLLSGSTELRTYSDKVVVSGGDLWLNPTNNISRSLVFDSSYTYVEMWAANEHTTQYADEDARLRINIKNKNTNITYRIALSYSNYVINISYSQTITHLSPVMNENDFEEIVIGSPVFADGNTYLVSEDGLFVQSSVNDTKDCVPGSTHTGTYKTFIGICVCKYAIGDKKEIGTMMTTEFEFKQNCIEFATHGDFLFKIPSDHQASEYTVGDTITFEGNIIDDEISITNRTIKSTIGTVTKIFAEDDYLAVFKTC